MRAPPPRSPSLVVGSAALATLVLTGAVLWPRARARLCNMLGLSHETLGGKDKHQSGLVQLPEKEQLSPLVVRVLGLNPGKYTLQGSNVYIVGRGHTRVLIDTAQGEPGFLPLLQSALAGATLSDVIVTHWHHDHVGGIPAIAEAFPEARFWKIPLGESDDLSVQEDKDEMGRSKLRPLRDGQRFAVPGADAMLRVVHCPGHTQDHAALIMESAKGMNASTLVPTIPVLFSGDCVLGQGSAVFEDLRQYLSSLRLLLREIPQGNGCMIYPGHGPVVPDARAKINAYIAHRMEREEQVLAALTSGKEVAMSPLDVVRIVYAKDNLGPALQQAASRSVLQHLVKLQKDGKVRRQEGDTWFVVGSRL